MPVNDKRPVTTDAGARVSPNPWTSLAGYDEICLRPTTAVTAPAPLHLAAVESAALTARTGDSRRAVRSA